MKKISGTPNWIRNCGFCESSYFFIIAQDCSLGQCLTSRTAETSKKILRQKLGLKWSFLF